MTVSESPYSAMERVGAAVAVGSAAGESEVAVTKLIGCAVTTSIGDEAASGGGAIVVGGAAMVVAVLMGVVVRRAGTGTGFAPVTACEESGVLAACAPAAMSPAVNTAAIHRPSDLRTAAQ